MALEKEFENTNKVNLNLSSEQIRHPLTTLQYGWHYESVISEITGEHVNIVFWGKDQTDKIIYRYIKMELSFFKEYFDFAIQEKNLNISGFKTIEEQFNAVVNWAPEAQEKLHNLTLIAAQLLDSLERSRADWQLELDIQHPNLETVLRAANFESFMKGPRGFYLDERSKIENVHTPELLTE